jgi:hypothetical protein
VLKESFAFYRIIRKDPCTALTARGVISSVKGADMQNNSSKKEPTTDARCGTIAGAQAHYVRGESYCQPCKMAKKNARDAYDKANPDKLKARNKRWRDKNPDKVKANSQRYFGRIRAYSLEQVIERYGTDCTICGLPIDFSAPRATKFDGWEMGLQIDHHIAISNGGFDCLENVRPVHGLCNIKKGNK